MELDTNLVTVENDDVDIYAILKFPNKLLRSSKFASEKLFPALAPGLQKLLQYIEEEKKIHPGTEKVNPVIWLAQYLIRNEERKKLTVYEEKVLESLQNLIFTGESNGDVEGESESPSAISGEETEDMEKEVGTSNESDDDLKKKNGDMEIVPLLTQVDLSEGEISDDIKKTGLYEETSVPSPECEILDETSFNEKLENIKNQLEEISSVEDYQMLLYSEIRSVYEALIPRSRFRYVILGSAGSFLPTPEKDKYISPKKQCTDDWTLEFPSGNKIVMFVYNSTPISEPVIEKYRKISDLLYVCEEEFYDTLAPPHLSGDSDVGDEENEGEYELLEDEKDNNLEESSSEEKGEHQQEEEEEEGKIIPIDDGEEDNKDLEEEETTKIPKIDEDVKSVNWNVVYSELQENMDLLQSEQEYHDYLREKGAGLLNSCFIGANVLFKFMKNSDDDEEEEEDTTKTLFRSMIFNAKDRENVFEFQITEKKVTEGTINISEDATSFLERVTDLLIETQSKVIDREARSQADALLLSSLREKLTTENQNQGLSKFLIDDVEPVLIDRVPGSTIELITDSEEEEDDDEDEEKENIFNIDLNESKTTKTKEEEEDFEDDEEIRIVRIKKETAPVFEPDESLFIAKLSILLKEFFSGDNNNQQQQQQLQSDDSDEKSRRIKKLQEDANNVHNEDEYREFEDKLVLAVHDEIPNVKCELVEAKNQPPVSPTPEESFSLSSKQQEWAVKDAEGSEFARIRIEKNENNEDDDDEEEEVDLVDDREAWFLSQCARCLGQARKSLEFYERLRMLEGFWKAGGAARDDNWKGELYLFVLKDLLTLGDDEEDEHKFSSGYVCEPLPDDEDDSNEEMKKFVVVRNLPQEKGRKVGQTVMLGRDCIEGGQAGRPSLTVLPNTGNNNNKNEQERVVVWKDRDVHVLGSVHLNTPATPDSSHARIHEKLLNERLLEYNENVNRILCQVEDRKRLKVLGEQMIKWLETTMRRKVVFGFLVPDAAKLEDEAIEDIIRQNPLFSNSFFVDGDKTHGVEMLGIKQALREGKRNETERYMYEPIRNVEGNVIGVVAVTCPVPDEQQEKEKKKRTPRKSKKKKKSGATTTDKFTTREIEQLENVFSIFHDAFRYIQLMKHEKEEFNKKTKSESTTSSKTRISLDDSDLTSETYFLKRLLIRTREKLLELTNNHILELVGYNSPPRAVFKTLKATLYLLNKRKRLLSKWNDCRRIVKRMKSTFFEKLISYDPTRRQNKMKFVNIRILLRRLSFLKMEKTSYPALVLYSFLVVVIDLRKQVTRIRKERRRKRKAEKAEKVEEEGEEEELEGEGEEEEEGEGEEEMEDEDDDDEEEEEIEEEEVSMNVNEDHSLGLGDSIEINEDEVIHEEEEEGEQQDDDDDDDDEGDLSEEINLDNDNEEEEGEFGEEDDDDDDDEVNVGDSVDFGGEEGNLGDEDDDGVMMM